MSALKPARQAQQQQQSSWAGAATLLSIVVLAFSTAVWSSNLPRTTSGHPDLNGVWAYGTATPLERPPRFAHQPFMTEKEAEEFRQQSDTDRRAAVASRIGIFDEAYRDPDRPFVTLNGRIPTSLILEPPDGHLPEMTLEAQRRAQDLMAADERLGGPEDIPLSERCVRSLAGPPISPAVEYPFVQIVQAADTIAFFQEDLHDTRMVQLKRTAHVSPRIRMSLGDSLGHWNDDTLLVDTTNFTTQYRQRRASNQFDRNLHVVERVTLLGPDVLLYEFTVDDPTVFVRTWGGAFTMRKTQKHLYEVACHEGNYGLANTLSGARVQESIAARAPATNSER